MRREMLPAHQLRFRALLCEIVEIETLGLSVLIVSDGQIGNGLSFRCAAFDFAGLFTLRFALQFFSPFFLASPFFLPFSKGGTRASCHNCSNNLMRNLLEPPAPI